jgi:hypothetical protein
MNNLAEISEVKLRISERIWVDWIIKLDI